MRLPSVAVAALLILPAAARGQAARRLLAIDSVNSAAHGWLRKPVHARRVLDDMTAPATWTFSGTGTLTFPASPRRGDMRVLRVDMTMFRDAPAPNRSRLSSVNLRRAFAGEDWSAYNRLSMWVRPQYAGITSLPLQIVLHNDGDVKVPDAYNREGTHYVTLTGSDWQQVVWEIEPLARDRVTSLE